MESFQLLKNLHLLVGEEVPTGLRLMVYRQALERIENGHNQGREEYGLCLMLAHLLYGIDFDVSLSTAIGYTYYRDAVPMFPELANFLVNGAAANYTNTERAVFLRATIKSLETMRILNPDKPKTSWIKRLFSNW